MNILSAWPWRGQIQIFVVFESDESEELMKWLQDVCEPALSEGLLVLAKARLPDGWHASIAKNTAHRLAVETLLQAAGGSAPQPTASGSGQAHSSLEGGASSSTSMGTITWGWTTCASCLRSFRAAGRGTVSGRAVDFKEQLAAWASGRLRS